MSLTLEVIGAKAARMGGAARKTFTASGTIGRLADNDWIFPDEYISGHHAKISFIDGAFLIEDTSTNGVFVNSQQNRLTRNRPHPLRSGDTLFIDDYEVRVTLGPEPVAVESYAPARSGSSGRPKSSLIPDDEPFFDSEPGAAGVPNATDPLALLGLQSAPTLAPGPTAASLQNASPLAQHYRPPTPSAPAPRPPPPPKRDATPGFIPDDYDPMGAEEDPLASDPFASGSGPSGNVRAGKALATPLSRTVEPAVPVPRASQTPTPPPRAAATIVTGPMRIPRPGSRSPPADPNAAPPPAKRDLNSNRVVGGQKSPAIDPFGEEGEASNSEGTSNMAAEPLPLPAAPPRANAPQGPGAGPSGGAGELDFAAMLEAAGLDSVRVTPELSQQFGMILRLVVAGLMDVLRARDKIKDEFRMRNTTFKQQNNNPLKFSVNVEDALHNLLVKRNAAYLGPVEAFEDAFLDVRHHQMAMLAGVRVAYEAMLAEFDPDCLQKEFDPEAKGGNFLSGGAKAKYWELYRTRFRDMVEDADSSFRHLFGDDFAKAYEEQLSRLRAAHRAGRK